MESGLEVADHGVNVKRYRSVLGPEAGGGGRGIARARRAVTEVEDKPARLAGRLGYPGAPRVERPDRADTAVHGAMSVTADHHIGAASREEETKLIVGDARVDPWAVRTSAGRGPNNTRSPRIHHRSTRHSAASSSTARNATSFPWTSARMPSLMGEA